jgi:uncharacterized damage-inducible protein DinB
MTLSDLRLLLDYHYWARDTILDAITTLTPEQFTRDLGSSFNSIRDTAAHLVGAETAWYERWTGRSPDALLPAENFPDVATIRTAWSDLEKKIRGFVEELGEQGISRVFEFKLLGGRPGSAIFWQNLQHLVNHGSYHRGQITTMLRQLGAQPPQSMDMIRFYRLHSNPTT